MKRRPKPVLITPALLRRWPLPTLHPKLGKDGRGSVLVVGRSVQNPGAVLLAAVGALRAGAGRLQIASARSAQGHLAVAVPEARVVGLPTHRSGELGTGCSRAIRYEIEHGDAILLGPGMMDARAAKELLAHCVRSRTGGLLVLDSAALLSLDPRRVATSSYRGGVVITPHAGEMARLWGCERRDVLANPLAVARAAAEALGVVVTLKGAQTFVVTPDGLAYCNTAGNAGLGTSGSGDALSGVIAGLAARGADAAQAAVWGVYLHAKAGDVLAARMGPLGFLARELLSEIPELLARTASKRRH